MFANVYSGWRAPVTEHTGFKGSWTSGLLLKLGADGRGRARDIPTQPGMVDDLGLTDDPTHQRLFDAVAEAGHLS